MNQILVKQRQSNIELLRNISMFMVLLLHSSFLAFGIPEANDIHGAPAIWGGQDISTRLGNSGGRCLCLDIGLVFHQAEDDECFGVLIPNRILESSEFSGFPNFGKNRCQQRYDNGVVDA